MDAPWAELDGIGGPPRLRSEPLAGPAEYRQRIWQCFEALLTDRGFLVLGVAHCWTVL
jgi:hypothetical protein